MSKSLPLSSLCCACVALALAASGCTLGFDWDKPFAELSPSDGETDKSEVEVDVDAPDDEVETIEDVCELEGAVEECQCEPPLTAVDGKCACAEGVEACGCDGTRVLLADGSCAQLVFSRELGSAPPKALAVGELTVAAEQPDTHVAAAFVGNPDDTVEVYWDKDSTPLHLDLPPNSGAIKTLSYVGNVLFVLFESGMLRAYDASKDYADSTLVWPALQLEVTRIIAVPPPASLLVVDHGFLNPRSTIFEVPGAARECTCTACVYELAHALPAEFWYLHQIGSDSAGEAYFLNHEDETYARFQWVSGAPCAFNDPGRALQYTDATYPILVDAISLSRTSHGVVLRTSEMGETAVRYLSGDLSNSVSDCVTKRGYSEKTGFAGNLILLTVSGASGELLAADTSEDCNPVVVLPSPRSEELSGLAFLGAVIAGSPNRLTLSAKDGSTNKLLLFANANVE